MTVGKKNDALLTQVTQYCIRLSLNGSGRAFVRESEDVLRMTLCRTSFSTQHIRHLSELQLVIPFKLAIIVLEQSCLAHYHRSFPN